MREPLADPPRDLEVSSVTSEIAVLAFTPDSVAPLTEAESRVAIALALGLSNRAIARELDVSLRTIANQVAAILKKLEATSRAEVAARFGICCLR
ncbi:MAG: LuxR C-terminal-related transcriptional regulator [Kofleriaceae bacterium]